MTKIILGQIDTIAGNIAFNLQKIEAVINQAKSQNANLVVFPKFSLVGFPFGDIFCRHKSLLSTQENALKKIINMADNIAIIVGCIDENFNSKLKVIQNKKNLNTNTIKIGSDTWKIVDYKVDNSIESAVNGIIFCDSCPSRAELEYKKNKYLSDFAQNNKVNFIYVNQVGYGDNYSFDGSSRMYDCKGKLVARGKFFGEDFIEIENNTGKIESAPDKIYNDIPKENFDLDYSADLDRTYQAIICAIRGYFNKTGFKKAVLGLSGGLDSTVCAVLLADAIGKENVYAVSMPTKISSKGSKDDANLLVQNLGINYIEAPINNETEIFTKELKQIFDKISADKYAKSTTFENIQARTRATILWSISNEFKSMLPIATSDKSEAYIGYATTNGDMSGGFAPIADVTKTKLFALADFLNKNRNKKNVIPQSILEKPPGAELKFDESKGRTITAEEDNMPYPFLDEIIWYVENKNFGYTELLNHTFIYEKEHSISLKQKQEWINKFFDKSQKAVFKWHILPLSVITDVHTINQAEYYHPIVSKFYAL